MGKEFHINSLDEMCDLMCGEPDEVLNMRTYHIDYRLFQFDKIKTIDVVAKSKKEAYRKAAFELIPEREGEYPYSAWVDSVTYQNGNYKEFNNFEGNPY